MDFITAVRYAKIGYRIRRACWPDERWLDEDESPDGYRWMDNALADDWEIILEGIISEFPIIYEGTVDE